MILHPLAAEFASVADAYERGRPEYAPAVVGALAAELGVAPGAPVLDLAAGTGKLTRPLLAAGLDVVAVEPQAPMRDRLAAIIGGERVREGFAEAIPLPDASVDAVTVADGFHWFNHAQALAEIRRVLTPRRRTGRALDRSGLERGLLGARARHADPAACAPSTHTSTGRRGRRRCGWREDGRRRERFA